MSALLWERLLPILETEGFEIISERRYKRSNFGHKTEPVIITAAHREKKLLLIARSVFDPYNEVVSDVTIYATLKRKAPSQVLPRNDYMTLKGDTVEIWIRELGGFPKEEFNKFPQYGDYTDWHNADREVIIYDLNLAEELSKFKYTRDTQRKVWKKFLDSAPDWVQAFIR